jgi:hypothetical protein
VRVAIIFGACSVRRKEEGTVTSTDVPGWRMVGPSKFSPTRSPYLSLVASSIEPDRTGPEIVQCDCDSVLSEDHLASLHLT